MYRALVGTVWATIRTGASIHHGQVTYSTLSGETKWSLWGNVNNSQWTIGGPISTLPTREPRTERVRSLVTTLMYSHMSFNCTLRQADMPHVKCSMFSSSCNYPIVMITQKITQLGYTRAFHLKNVTFLKSNQSEMIFSARLFFFVADLLSAKYCKLWKKERKKLKNVSFSKDTYCGIYDLKAWINNATITKILCMYSLYKGTHYLIHVWTFVFLQLILDSFILTIIILWGLLLPP